MRRLTRTETTLAEFGSSTTLLAMAFVMLDPWPTLDQPVPVVPIFHLMLQITSEHGWGFIFLAVGAFQSGANLMHSVAFRKLAAFVAAVTWGLIGFLGVMSHPPSFFVPIAGAHCIVQCIVYLRLAVMQEGLRSGGD